MEECPLALGVVFRQGQGVDSRQGQGVVSQEGRAAGCIRGPAEGYTPDPAADFRRGRGEDCPQAPPRITATYRQEQYSWSTCGRTVMIPSTVSSKTHGGYKRGGCPISVQRLRSRFSYGFPIFWVQLPLLLPLRLFPASVPDIPPFETASVHAPLITPIFFVDFVISGCALGTTKKAAMECPSPPLL